MREMRNDEHKGGMFCYDSFHVGVYEEWKHECVHTAQGVHASLENWYAASYTVEALMSY